MSAVTATYVVMGMTCGHCVSSVSEELNKIDRVSDVQVDLPSGKVDITSEAAIEQSVIEEAIKVAGFEVAS